MNKLFTRDQFREGVFSRDGHKCVICRQPAVDAHHILERRLFSDGGYYLDNGASVCETHHLQAEMTTLTCEELREAIGIKIPVIPPHMYTDTRYDKWGNPILDNGQRIRGELFQDSSVQKILTEGQVLGDFVKYVKYPRTYHLPWSPGITDDDRSLPDTSCFNGKEVVVTVKMDGENTTMYNDYIHARAVNANNHPSRDWVKSLHGKIQGDIPDGWRLCGENLYAEHSIHYKDLLAYFMLFSVWDDKNICLSWDDTIFWAELFELKTVPVLYKGIWDEEKIRRLFTPKLDDNECEGYVVRLANSFPYSEFRKSAAKYVRKNHIQSHGHWFRKGLIPNELKK